MKIKNETKEIVVSSLTSQIRNNIEQIQAIQRVESYMREDLIRLKFQIPLEENTFEVLDSIKARLLKDIDGMAFKLDVTCGQEVEIYE